MEVLFWASVIFIVYVYAGYPAVLAVLRYARGRRVRKAHIEPPVTVIIAAHNERDRIEEKLRNCLDLDYPRNKLQIIVSLDGPTDGTEFAVWKWAARGVEIVHSKEHLGKASALNRAVRSATGDVIVFADVRQMFAPSALRELIANFADDEVGAVTGQLVLMDASREEAKTDVGIYWRYEKALRAMETQIHSALGATGAIYAIRRDLYSDIPEDTLLDDVLIPMRIVLRGKRAVFDPAAIAYDEVACCPEAEYGRKVRTLAGNYQLLLQAPELLLPFRNPVFFQFVSHKLGRLLIPYALLTVLITNLFLLDGRALSGLRSQPLTLEGIYLVTFAAQCAWYLFALGGYFLAKNDIAPPMVIVQEGKKAA